MKILVLFKFNKITYVPKGLVLVQMMMSTKKWAFDNNLSA